MLRKTGVELLDQLRFVVAGISALEKTAESFVEEAFPGFLFAAGIDREEESAVLLRGVEVAGSVADHQDLGGAIFIPGRELEVFGFGPHFLPGNDFHKRVEAVL